MLIFKWLVAYTPLKSMSSDYICKTLHLQGDNGYQCQPRLQLYFKA